MPLWRCPHCATPQAEAARCWVCRRSTTSCATCRHFRRGVTAQLGYCGLDRRRLALRGDEMRACWSAPAAMPEPAAVTTTGSPTAATLAAAGGGRSGRTFVPVEDVSGTRASPGEPRGGPASDGPRKAVAGGAGSDQPRWSLWGEAEPPT